MTQDEIIRMAREAGALVFQSNFCGSSFDFNSEQLERFAALVAAHERNRHAWTQEHWTEYEHAIAAAEREACAKMCEEEHNKSKFGVNGMHCAAAIRARGE